MANRDLVSFIVPVRNDAARLERCLRSIRANDSSGLDVEVVVADNGSVDRSPSVAHDFGAELIVVPDVRVADLRNRATMVARGTIFAFVDADHEVAPTWLQSAATALSDPTVGAVGALYTVPPNPTWVQEIYGALRGATIGTGDTSWLGAGNLVVRRKAFELVRGFDIALTACEDVDLCRRLKVAGWRVVGASGLKSLHYGDPPTLRRLFRAELWRGRDNLSVTFRRPWALRELPSAIIPLVELVLATVGFVAGLLSPFLPSARIPAGLILIAVIGLVSLRALRIATRLTSRRPLNLLRAWAVAGVFDSARALALLGRAPHHRQTPTSETSPRTTA